MKLRLGIIGAGNIASAHIQNVLDGKCPNIEIVAVADRKESRRQWAAEKLPDARIFTEGSDLIAAKCCDAVLIAVPHYQHPTLAIEAFRAGQHVMCEKPAGVYTLQVREMIAEADKHPELTFGMMFNQRTNCVYRKMKEMLDAGELGELKRVNWIVTDWYRTQFYYIFYTVPYEGEYNYSDAMAEYAAANNCTYLNLFEHMDDVGLNGDTDFMCS